MITLTFERDKSIFSVSNVGRKFTVINLGEIIERFDDPITCAAYIANSANINLTRLVVIFSEMSKLQ